MSNFFKNILFKGARFAERLAAKIQGKGYGAATIKQEYKILSGLLKLKHGPMLAIDIGGNVGDYSAEIRRFHPDAEIHIFEPSKKNITILQDRFESDRKVKIIPCAVGDRVGSATLFSNEPGSGLASLTQRRLDHFNIDFSLQESISIIKFEDYWRDHLGERVIDVVKIDIEGHEMSALNGFGAAIQKARAIQFEFGGCNIDSKTYFQDFWYFFKEQKFEIYRITPIGPELIKSYREADEYFSTTNFVAINKQILQS